MLLPLDAERTLVEQIAEWGRKTTVLSASFPKEIGGSRRASGGDVGVGRRWIRSTRVES